MGGVGTRGNRDLDGGSDGHMKRIFRRARSLPVTVLCLLAAPALAVGPGALESAGQRARRRVGPDRDRRPAGALVGRRPPRT